MATYPSAKTLSGIAVVPNSINKYVGESVAKSELEVTASYSDGSSKVLSAEEYEMGAYDNTAAGVKEVALSYTEGGVTKEATLTVTYAEAYTLYFSNNKSWSEVHAYVWNTAAPDKPEVGWPGNECTYVSTNNLGEDIYMYKVDKKYNSIVFNNRNGEQTVDITIDDSSSGYYLTEKSDGKWSYGTYVYGE